MIHIEEARRRLGEAALVLAELRECVGLPAAQPSPPGWATEPSLRPKYDAARAQAANLAGELEKAWREIDGLSCENGALRASSAQLEERLAEHREALLAASPETVKREFSRLREKISLLEDGRMRLEFQLRKTDEAVAQTLAEKLALEETSRREMRAARAALDRSAGETVILRQRLDQTAASFSALERESQLASQRSAAELALVLSQLQRAQAAEAALRQELSAVEPASATPVTEPAPEARDFVQPALEPLLDPGWSRLLRLVRPSVEAAYAHLRRLSAVPLASGPKALLRLAASSIASAADSLTSIELALEEGPASVPAAPAIPVLEQALTSWEAALRRRGIALSREVAGPLPDAPHDVKELRVLLFHILRNALEALPAGARVTVRATRTAEGALCVDFADDGPGFSKAWLERRFEPFAQPRRDHAGLGLAVVRRTMRRWGGEAEASNGAGGRGARLRLTFAPPRPPALSPEPG